MDAAVDRARAFRVLVVDDNRDAADSLALLLRAWGYEVRTAYDGKSALAEASADPPDCCFLDIGMPGMDGYDLARHLRRLPALGTAKLVALTAYSGDEHGRRAQEAGFDHRLVKPAAPEAVERLLKMIEEVMRLATRAEELTRESVQLAREAKELLGEARGDLRNVKQDIREVKQEIKEVREELREVKDAVAQERQDRRDGDNEAGRE